MKKTQWYKDAVCYQIWPRSFCDGNGDGIGDLEGVLSKLDYLKELGVTCIWFSPLYCSPNADFGYDISDYKNISPDYGDNELFKKVLDEAHARGMKVIMDLVVNHSSDEHEWFKKGIDKNSKYHDYYIWRDGKDGKLPKIRPALMADAIATSVGAILGTSTTTTFVESSAGVAAGGRTGLTAVVTGVLFLIASLFAPIFTAIPGFATAPALIFVGFMMFTSIADIKFSEDNYTEAIPAYLAIVFMVLSYSIADGIAVGMISYVIINAFTGKHKKISPLMYVLALLFVMKYIFL